MLRTWQDHSGTAAVEFALALPFLALLLVGLTEFGMAFYQQSKLVAAVSAGAEYAFLAGQKNLTLATLVQNTGIVVRSAFGSDLAASNVRVVVNNGTSTGARCCIGASDTGGAPIWSCGNSPICSDGSNPGQYVTITASYPFVSLFSQGSFLAGKTLTMSLTARIQ